MPTALEKKVLEYLLKVKVKNLCERRVGSKHFTCLRVKTCYVGFVQLSEKVMLKSLNWKVLYIKTVETNKRQEIYYILGQNNFETFF